MWPVIPKRSERHAVEFPAFLTACDPASASYCHLLSSIDSRKSVGGKFTIPSLVKESTRQGFSLAFLPLDRVLMRFRVARPRKTCDSVPLDMLLPPPAPPSLALLTRQTEIVLVSPRIFHTDSANRNYFSVPWFSRQSGSATPASRRRLISSK